MNEKQKRLHQTFLQAKTFTKKMLTLLFCKQKPLLKNAHAIAKGTGIIFTGTIIGMLFAVPEEF